MATRPDHVGAADLALGVCMIVNALLGEAIGMGRPGRGWPMPREKSDPAGDPNRTCRPVFCAADPEIMIAILSTPTSDLLQ
ncbi:hypothetical protein ACWCYZ_16680 [Streptomyces virginiae]